MRWECRECGRVHDHDPGVCVCGSADQRQCEPLREQSMLERARTMLLDPSERQLVPDGPLVTLLFRVIVAATLVLLFLVATNAVF
jgi:hypothetical protein